VNTCIEYVKSGELMKLLEQYPTTLRYVSWLVSPFLEGSILYNLI
jgi:hypothetical protein